MTVAEALPPHSPYRAQSPWRPFPAVAATVVVVALSMAAPVAMIVAMRDGSGLQIDAALPVAWLPLIVSQAIMTFGAWWLAGRFGGKPAQVMALEPRPLSAAAITTYFLVIGLTSLAYTFAIWRWQPDVVLADMATFRPLVNSTAWPVYAAIIAVGAPLSEELLFRGFLQSALTRSRLGFVGASVITTVMWSLLHFQYSIYGLAEIFVVGFALCYVLYRTGSLWSTILLHAMYNGAQFVGMRWSLFPWT